MIIDTIYADDVFRTLRLDAEFHLSDGVKARRKLGRAKTTGLATARLGGSGGLAEVSQPGRFKRVYAEPLERCVPYLRPYDVFDYLPVPADYLSAERTSSLDVLQLQKGCIVIPASGRNLGPAVAVDAHLAEFALSHDAIRLCPIDPEGLPYILTFMNSPTGQAILRSGITGSVIDHIAVSDVADLEIPLLKERERTAITELMRSSIRLREEARVEIATLVEQLSNSLGVIDKPRLSRGWTVEASSLSDRLDAAAYAPQRASVSAQLLESGGRLLADVAHVDKPASRYKAYHVGAKNGQPFLTGGQLLQARVIAPKYMAQRVFQEPEKYELGENEIVFAADGRANEGLGLPVMVTPERRGWLASEHVMRLRAHGTSAGSLYLGLCTEHVQIQLQSLPRGSVVDTLYVDDVRDIIVPTVSAGAGTAAEAAWQKFSCADALEQRAIFLFEAALSRDGDDVPDVILNVREAAAMMEIEAERVLELVFRGVLTPVGQLGNEDAFILLRDVLAANVDVPISEFVTAGWRTLYGQVRDVGEEFFSAELAADFVQAGELVTFPKGALRSDEASLLEPGAHLVFRSRTVPSAGGAPEGSTHSWTIRLLPHAILTEEQVNESYRWADRFMRSYISGGTAVDHD